MAYLGRQPNTGVRSRYIFTATASQTTFSGTDDDGKTLKYEDAAYVDVFLNGVLLKPVTDYTATTKTSVVLASGASASDIVEIIAYDIANIADTVSKANGGTFDAGVTVNGTVTADGLTVDTNTLYVDAANNSVGIGTSTPNPYGKFVVDDGKISLVTDTPTSRRLSFWSTANGNSENAYIQAQNDGATTNTGEILFATKNSGGSLGERVRITAGGYTRFATPSVSATQNLSGSGNILAVEIGSSFGDIAITTNCGAYTSAYAHQRFYNGNGIVGNITTSGSSTAFNTSSDYRLKENVTDLTGAIDRVKQVPVHRFNFIADPDTTVDGFLAHEVQAVVPEAITGEKDAVDEDGNIEPQSIDQSKLVPLLTQALKDAITKIEALEARVATLENA